MSGIGTPFAVERGLPYCAPGWVLAWWRHVATKDAELRVVVVLDGERLVGVAPFYARRQLGGIAQYRMVGAALSPRIEPLARPQDAEAVADVLARTLAAARPAPAILRFEGIPEDSPWPRLLARAWPGRGQPFVHAELSTPAPTVSLHLDGSAAWMASKSGNFRQQMRRSRRKLEQAGGVFRTAATPEEVAVGLPDFERLHQERWASRGGSNALRPGVTEMLHEAGRALVAQGRYRLESIVVDGETVSSHLFVSAGRETAYWLGGFDERFAAQHPAMVSLVAAVEKGFERGDARLDLGPGGQAYKYRLADGEDCLDWITLIPPGPHHARAMLLFLPRRTRDAIRGRLPPETRARLRRLLGLRPRAR